MTPIHDWLSCVRRSLASRSPWSVMIHLMTDWGKWATAFVAAFKESDVVRDTRGRFADEPGAGVDSDGDQPGAGMFGGGSKKQIGDRVAKALRRAGADGAVVDSVDIKQGKTGRPSEAETTITIKGRFMNPEPSGGAERGDPFYDNDEEFGQFEIVAVSEETPTIYGRNTDRRAEFQLSDENSEDGDMAPEDRAHYAKAMREALTGMQIGEVRDYEDPADDDDDSDDRPDPLGRD